MAPHQTSFSEFTGEKSWSSGDGEDVISTGGGGVVAAAVVVGVMSTKILFLSFPAG